MRLTAVLDFDFAHVATAADEFLRSLEPGIGLFPSARESDETTALHTAMLEGFPDPLPPSSEGIDWTAARVWDDALREKGAERPRTLTNIARLADLSWLLSQILPFKLCNKVVASNSSPEQLHQRKEEGESKLIRFLDDHGV